jgi:hypothetical protein
MKLFSMFVGAAGVLVVTGFPPQRMAAPSLVAVWQAVSHAVSPAAELIAVPDRGAQWAECGSLLLLATGMFGAAVLVGRGRG